MSTLRVLAQSLIALAVGYASLVVFPSVIVEATSHVAWLLALWFASPLAAAVLFVWLAPGASLRYLVLAVLPAAAQAAWEGTRSDATAWPLALVPALFWLGLAAVFARALSLLALRRVA
jgi:hypothetical protein